jgi:hypothetical protein
MLFARGSLEAEKLLKLYSASRIGERPPPSRKAID